MLFISRTRVQLPLYSWLEDILRAIITVDSVWVSFVLLCFLSVHPLVILFFRNARLWALQSAPLWRQGGVSLKPQEDRFKTRTLLSIDKVRRIRHAHMFYAQATGKQGMGKQSAAVVCLRTCRLAFQLRAFIHINAFGRKVCRHFMTTRSSHEPRQA